jgi:cupin superfamily acireductone dioxygenase involved in methionine salvage
MKSVKLNTTPNDFVFFPQFSETQRNKVMQIVAKLFKRIVAETGIEEKTDKKLTLYSLRHTAIMLRLTIAQVDTLSLARNARTSQAMIDKFYAAHLTTDQVRKQLHAFPTVKRKKKTAPRKSLQRSPTQKHLKLTRN